MPDPAPDSSDAAARRGAAGDARADVAAAPRVADLSALLGELDALRTSLQTDLTLAAAALDAGAPDLAHELVAADADQLATVQESALLRLRDLDAVSDAPVGDAPIRAAAGLDLPAAAEPGDAQPTTPSPAVQHRRRTARGRRLLPAAVLASAAAATIAFVLLSAETAPRRRPSRWAPPRPPAPSCPTW